MAGYNQSDKAAVKNPAKTLAYILSEELGVSVDAIKVDQMLVDSWDELSFYAHAHHRQQHRRNDT